MHSPLDTRKHCRRKFCVQALDCWRNGLRGVVLQQDSARLHIYMGVFPGGDSDAKSEFFQFSQFFSKISFRRGGGGMLYFFWNLQEKAISEKYGSWGNQVTIFFRPGSPNLGVSAFACKPWSTPHARFPRASDRCFNISFQ